MTPLHALCRLALMGGAVLVTPPAAALAADTALVAELEQRLSSAGVEPANDHLLSAQPDAVLLSRFNRMTAACELHAVSLALRLARDTRSSAAQAHEGALRTASGRCPRFVLALVALAQVPKVCASQPTWGAAQTARELRQRIAEIDADALLRATAPGQACRAAYLYELKNTRVVLRAVSQRPAVQER